MIGLLPVLRWPGWRAMARAGVPGRARRSVTVRPPSDMAPPPPWLHRPPEARNRAEKCGQCGENIPPASVDGEFCTSLCASRWLTEHASQPHTCQLPPGPVPQIVPDTAPEPAWIAAWTGWERAKAAAIVAERQSPSSEAAA